MRLLSPLLRRTAPRWATIVGLVIAVAGCITPSIPIPPPDPAHMTFQLSIIDTVSTASFTYPPDANYHAGVVYIYNRDRGTGVIQNVNPDNSIGPSPRFAAAVGEQIVVSIQTSEQTESICVRLRDGTGQDANSCAP